MPRFLPTLLLVAVSCLTIAQLADSRDAIHAPAYTPPTGLNGILKFFDINENKIVARDIAADEKITARQVCATSAASVESTQGAIVLQSHSRSGPRLELVDHQNSQSIIFDFRDGVPTLRVFCGEERRSIDLARLIDLLDHQTKHAPDGAGR